MKKLISIILCACMIFALASCAAKPDYTKIYQPGSSIREDELFADREALTAFLSENLEHVTDKNKIEDSYSYWEFNIFVKDGTKSADIKKITENLEYASVGYMGKNFMSIKDESKLEDVAYIVVSIDFDAVAEYSADDIADDVERISANKAVGKIVLSRVAIVLPA